MPQVMYFIVYFFLSYSHDLICKFQDVSIHISHFECSFLHHVHNKPIVLFIYKKNYNQTGFTID